MPTLYPSQQRAVDRITSYYRRSNNAERWGLEQEIEEKEKGYAILRVEMRWLGESDRVGAQCREYGSFLIGPRGRVVVLAARSGVWGLNDCTTHVANMLDADVGYGAKKPPQKRPSRYRGRGKTAKVWELADANPTLSRRELVDLAVKQGINRNTASTQYGHWLRMQKACGHR